MASGSPVGPPRRLPRDRRRLRLRVTAAVVGALLLGLSAAFVAGLLPGLYPRTSTLTESTPTAPICPPCMGDPVLFRCPSASVYATEGCRAGDYVYNVSFSGTGLPLGDLRFGVDNRSGSALVTAEGGGFSLVGAAGALLAQSTFGPTLWMNDSWTTYGTGASSSTMLLPTDLLFIDVGTHDPAGLGYECQLTAPGGVIGRLALP